MVARYVVPDLARLEDQPHEKHHCAHSPPPPSRLRLLGIEKIHAAYSIHLFNKGQPKSMHQKTRSLHTTPTDPAMGEDHAIRALCPENNEYPPSTRNQELSHTPRHPLGETRALIWFSRHLASGHRPIRKILIRGFPWSSPCEETKAAWTMPSTR
jgi:hypothetical protein